MKRSGMIEKKPAQGIGSPISPRLLTLKKAAEYLGLTLWAMRERVWAGDIPVIRFPNGRKMYIDSHDLDTFIAQNKERIV
jgi:excisionase family DNA binding protein